MDKRKTAGQERTRFYKDMRDRMVASNATTTGCQHVDDELKQRFGEPTLWRTIDLIKSMRRVGVKV